MAEPMRRNAACRDARPALTRVGRAGLVLVLAALLLGCAAGAALAAGEKAKGPEFPNVPHVPVPPGVDYGGFFEKHQPVKIVFGVSDAGRQMKESLTNAAYTIKYLKPRGIPYEIEFVLYANAVLPASQFATEGAGYAPLMKALHEQGVSFKVCNNSLAALDQSPDDLYEYMELIPAGILEIVKKQMQGFTYISNGDGISSQR